MANEYRVSQESIEVLHDGAAKARVSQESVEVLHDGAAKARVSQLTVEVLRSVAIATVSARRRQMVND
jgi:hypothetical protein